MTGQDLLEYLVVDSATPQILRIIRDESATVSEIAEGCDCSESVIRKRLNPLIEMNMVEKADSSYRATGLGAMLLYTYNQLDQHDLAAITNIFSTENRYSILRALHDQPQRKARLYDGLEDPSQSTVRRTLREFELQEWIIRDSDGLYNCTSRGAALLTRIQTAVHRLDLLIEHEPFLHKCDPDCADFPVQALSDARIIEGSPGQAFAERNAYVEFMRQLNETKIDHIRQFAPVFDVEMQEVYWPFVEAGTQIDLVSPEQVQYELPTTPAGLRYAKKGLAAENVEWYIYPGSIPVGIVLFDDEWAVIGLQEPFGVQRTSATVFTQHEEIIDWAVDTYLSYFEEAQPPSQHVLNRIRTLYKEILD